MAGGHMKYRTLGRNSAHRVSMLRNLVTSLIEHEAITTTWPKAKETQRMAEKLISLGKRNTDAARMKASGIFFKPAEMLPKLFGPIRERYANRPGGYTRVLRIEPEKDDQAPSAIISLVDGPRDMRLAMTAQTIARDRSLGQEHSEMTKLNIAKLTKYDGWDRLNEAIANIEKENLVERAEEMDEMEVIDKWPVAPNRGETEEMKFHTSERKQRNQRTRQKLNRGDTYI